MRVWTSLIVGLILASVVRGQVDEEEEEIILNNALSIGAGNYRHFALSGEGLTVPTATMSIMGWVKAGTQGDPDPIIQAIPTDETSPLNKRLIVVRDTNPLRLVIDGTQVTMTGCDVNTDPLSWKHFAITYVSFTTHHSLLCQTFSSTFRC